MSLWFKKEEREEVAYLMYKVFTEVLNKLIIEYGLEFKDNVYIISYFKKIKIKILYKVNCGSGLYYWETLYEQYIPVKKKYKNPEQLRKLTENITQIIIMRYDHYINKII